MVGSCIEVNACCSDGYWRGVRRVAHDSCLDSGAVSSDCVDRWASGCSEDVAERRSPQGRRPASNIGCTRGGRAAAGGGSDGGDGISAAVAAKEGVVWIVVVMLIGFLFHVRSDVADRDLRLYGSVGGRFCT